MEQQLQDKIVVCRHCAAPMCYEKHSAGFIGWSCLICGFETNTLFQEGTDAVKGFEQTLPELYKDIKFVDEAMLVWYPMYVERYGVGIVFADGTNKDDWRWSFAPHLPVEPHEQDRFRDKEGNPVAFKTSMNSVIQFDRDQFARAIEALGFI